MEILEENLDEFFNLNPFLAEMYSNYSSSTSSGVSDHGGATAVAICSTNSWNIDQETISPLSSSLAVAEAQPPPLISCENDRFSSYEDHGTDCNTLPTIISFSASSDKDDFGKRERVSMVARTPLQAQDHVMAERKRRDNLRQLFISLSKVVPGLKKLDKASLLEDAIKYLKVLQERVTALEKEEIMRSIGASREDNTSSSLSKSKLHNNCGFTPPEISVRISDRHVLLKTCCKKQMGLMSRIPCEMENIQLSVIDLRIMPFGGGALDVTILAEMQRGFFGTVKDIVDHMQHVLGQANLRKKKKTSILNSGQ